MARRNGLTRRQQDTLTVLIRHYTCEGRMPTIREVGKALGLRSTAAYHHIDALIGLGYVRRTGHRSRLYELTELAGAPQLASAQNIPILKSVASGISLTPGNIAGYWPMPLGFAVGERPVLVRSIDGTLIAVTSSAPKEHDLVATAIQERVDTHLFGAPLPRRAKVLGKVVAVVEVVNPLWATRGAAG